MRATSAPARHAKHNKVRKQTKGMIKSRRRSYRLGKQAVVRALQYQYRDRRTRKREFRKLWTIRINAAARENGTTYSQLIDAMNKANITVNRKMLADIAVSDPKAFTAIVKLSTK
jgi:large subunit ribosomal protein L20